MLAENAAAEVRTHGAVLRCPAGGGSMTEPDADRDPLRRPRCQSCHDVIGAYEPMVLENHQGRTDTSLAAEPWLYETDQPCFHRVCYDRALGHGR